MLPRIWFPLEKRSEQKIIQSKNASLYDIVIVNNFNERLAGTEISKAQTGSFLSIFQRSRVDEKIKSHHQTIERSKSDRIRREDDSAVMVVKNRVHNAFLTAVDIVVTPKFKKTVRYNSGSSSRRPNSVVHKHGQRDFLGNEQNTPLMMASRRLGLNIDQERNIETLEVQNSEYSIFPA